MRDNDPVTTNPDQYRVVFENEHVRVLDYSDSPGFRLSTTGVRTTVQHRFT